MKLINLEIEGLNSFKNKTTIDFKSLFDKKFFGIFGATGSGKSSILDAVFFALYGKVLRVKNEFEFINMKKNSATAKLLFEMRDKGVDKIFEVLRTYKLSSKNQITKSASIYLVNGDEKTLLASGDKETTAKVNEIIGFGENEFQRFIALPQGQFSKFLKDSPKEKIATMAKMFNLEKYGDEFAKKLRMQRNENLRRKEYLKGVLDQYANVDDGVIKAEEEQARALEKQRKTKQQDVLILRNDLLEAEKNYSYVKEKEKIDETLNELAQQEGEIQNDKKNLAILKATFSLHPLFSKLKLLKEEKENLELENSRLADEISKTSSTYISTVAINDKSKTDLSVKLAQLESRQSLLLAIRQDAERYKDLEKQKNTLSAKIESEKMDVSKLKEVYDGHSLSLENNLRIIADLEEFVVHDNIGGNVIDAAREFEHLKAYCEALKLSLSDAVSEKNAISERKEKLLKELVDNDEKLGSYKAQIANVNKTIKEMFSGDDNIQKAVVDSTKKIAYLKLQGTLFLENEIEIKSLSKQAKYLLQDIKNEQEVQKNITEDLEKVKSDIISSAEDGKIDKEKIKKLKELQKTLKASLENSKQTEIVLEEKRDNVLAQQGKLERKQKEFLKEDESFRDITIEKLENKILSAENVLYKLLDLSSSLERAKESAQAKERACVKTSSVIDEISKEEKVSLEKIEKLEGSLKKAQSKLEEFEKLNKDGVLKSAQAYDENFNSQIIVLNQQKGVIPQIIRFVGLKQQSAEKYFDAKASLNQHETKLEQINLDMKLILNKLRDLNVKGYIKDEIANNFSEIDSLRQTLKAIEDAESEILRTETKLKIQKASVISSLVLKEEEIENTSEKLRGECKIAGVSEEELLETVVYDDITNLEEKISEYDSKLSNAKAESLRLKALIGGKRVTQSKILAIKEKLEKTETAEINLASEVGFLVKQIEKDKENVKKLAYFKQELEKVQEKEMQLSKLTALNENDAILKYLTDEYILLITEKANTYFATLTNGRFQLVFSGDFLVVDNLNGGLTRSVGTLSGGETFLASLSLAISIVEVISSLREKPLDFVFLDEGFGTLDETSIEMVMTALRRLRETKLVFGLITHEELVKFKTPTRIEVYKSEENGSRIETVL